MTTPKLARGLRGGQRFTIKTPLVDFGTWELIGDELVLKRRPDHRIHLKCNSSALILDGIFHYRAKGLTAQEKADMLDAIEVILHPRKNYCSFGQDLRPSGAEILAKHHERINQAKRTTR